MAIPVSLIPLLTVPPAITIAEAGEIAATSPPNDSLFTAILNSLVNVPVDEAEPVIVPPVEVGLEEEIEVSLAELLAGGSLIALPPAPTTSAPPAPVSALRFSFTSLPVTTPRPEPIERAERAPVVPRSPETPTRFNLVPSLSLPAEVEAPPAPLPTNPAVPALQQSITSKIPLQTPTVAELLPRASAEPAVPSGTVAATESVTPSASSTVEPQLTRFLPELGWKTDVSPVPMRTQGSADAFRVQFALAGTVSLPPPSTGTTTVASPNPVAMVPPTSEPLPIAAQIAERILPQVQSGTEGRFDVRMRLDPVELGEVRIHLTVAGDGVSGRIVAANDAARFAIEAQIPDLRQRFETMGFQLGPMDVSTQPGSGDARHPAPWTRDKEPGPTLNKPRAAAPMRVSSTVQSALDVRV